MSGHADTIRRTLNLVIASDRANPLWEDAADALDALDALVVEQADRIAWLEGEVAGWRIKLAECEAESKRLRDALTEIDTFPISEDLSAGYHFAEVRSIARAAVAYG